MGNGKIQKFKNRKPNNEKSEMEELKNQKI